MEMETSDWWENNICVLTYELCRFVRPFVDKGLEGLLHAIYKLLVLHETNIDDVIDFILKIQKLLNHRLIFLWVDYDCATKDLRYKKQDF